MKLISFLLENIYWVIVVGGVLFSMFGRSGAKRRTNRMPSFGGGNEPNKPVARQEWEEEDEEDDSSRPYPAQRAARPEPVPSMSPYQPQKPIMTGSSVQGEGVGSGEGNSSPTLERAVQAAPSRPAEPPRARLAAAKPQSAVAAESRAELATPNADELRKAIVWAEILGPPRSKRPFGK